ncbi:hypothetical protein [Capnocytophaga catalasegens]|nr:hypothetical protein [Capnocytophaga catalasegens]
MKHTIIMSLLAVFMGLMSCEKENKDEYPEIKIGKGSESLKEISINKLTERKIVLSGGNEKFLANVENSKLAQVTIHKDTLKIKGLLEGETFATITSHDRKVYLKINVIPQEISISQDFVRLFPRDESKFISLTGGGDIVNLKIDDPDEILDVKWNGRTNILEIKALNEGEATITAISKNVEPKKLKILVQSEGIADKIGYYNSSSRTLLYIKPKMVIKQPNGGIVLSHSMNPYGFFEGFIQRSAVRVSHIANPQKKQNVRVEIKSYPYPDSFSVKTGTYSVYIEEVRDTNFVIRGKGFKFVLPK